MKNILFATIWLKNGVKMKFQCLKAEIFDDLLFIETKTDQYKLKTIS